MGGSIFCVSINRPPLLPVLITVNMTAVLIHKLISPDQNKKLPSFCIKDQLVKMEERKREEGKLELTEDREHI